MIKERDELEEEIKILQIRLEPLINDSKNGLSGVDLR